MSEVVTNKEINLDQLGHESLIDLNTIIEADGTKTITSSVDQTTLEKFINTHVANPKWTDPNPQPEPTITEKLASVGLDINDLKTALGM